MNDGSGGDVQRWNRRILNAYWALIALITVMEFIALLIFNQSFLKHVFPRFVAIHAFGLMTVMLVTEIGNAYLPRYSDYVVSLSATILGAVFVYSHPEFKCAALVYTIPLLVATSYFKRKIIFAVTIGNSLSYALIYLVNGNPLMRLKRGEMGTTFLSLLLIGLLALVIIERGRKINSSFLKSQQESQELLIKNALLDKQMKVDALTELYNHMTFHNYLNGLIEQNHTNNLHFQLALIDIDDFKSVNDSFGHRAGDIVLKRIAKIIKDSIAENDFAARYGGEEFAILFTEKSVCEAYATVEEIRQKIADTKHKEINYRFLTVSIGLKSYAKNGKEKLFRDTDRALYDSKKNGKNRTTLLA